MKFLRKKADSLVIGEGLSYAVQSQRPRIRQLLKNEQQGFCAYSERYFQNTDETHIDHFDGRLKNTNEDGYYNWFVVLARMNTTKPKKIAPYEPILSPHSGDLATRIQYKGGTYSPIDENDLEAKNLIKYLGFNKLELADDREKHIARIKFLKSHLQEQEFEEHLQIFPNQLSFITALEVELGMSLSHLTPPPHTNSHT